MTQLPVFKGDNPFTVQPLVYSPDFDADEATIRAREAIISTGVFYGSEEMIRAGLLDHTHGVQSALELQRYQHVPLNILVTHPHGLIQQRREVVTVGLPENSVRVSYGLGTRLARWLARVHHLFVRSRVRYEKLKKEHAARIHEYASRASKAEIALRDAQATLSDQKDALIVSRDEIRHLERRLERARVEYRTLKAKSECKDLDELQRVMGIKSEKTGKTVVMNPHSKKEFIVCYSCGFKLREADPFRSSYERSWERCDKCLSKSKADLDQSIDKARKNGPNAHLWGKPGDPPPSVK